jgi:hypothetical protein
MTKFRIIVILDGTEGRVKDAKHLLEEQGFRVIGSILPAEYLKILDDLDAHDVAYITYHEREDSNELKQKISELKRKNARIISDTHSNISGTELAEKILKSLPEHYMMAVLAPLLPLHLALQAFFGISRDENGSWIEISKAKDIDEEWKMSFPNRQAFLPLEDAHVDPFAALESRLGAATDAPKDGDVNEQPLLYLVQKFFDEIVSSSHNIKKNSQDAMTDIEDIKKKIEDIIQDKDLKSICHILANPIVLSDSGKKYDERIKQVEEWNGKEFRAKSVIDKIDVLVNYLSKVFEFKTEPQQVNT